MCEMKPSYSGFAKLYDMFMEEVPYESWKSFLWKRLNEQGIKDGLIAELGCGTGTMCELFSDAGYDMIGIDLSEEMLAVAEEKKLDSGKDILYLWQDMREFELHGTVKAIISVCDSINYIIEKEDLKKVFQLAYTYLEEKGVFLFDFHTEYYYREVLGNCTIAENREEGSFIWENYYEEEEKINEYDLTLFLKTGKLYEKQEECHVQKAYSREEIKKLLEEVGFTDIIAWDGYEEKPVSEETERIVVRACKSVM